MRVKRENKEIGESSKEEGREPERREGRGTVGKRGRK